MILIKGDVLVPGMYTARKEAGIQEIFALRINERKLENRSSPDVCLLSTSFSNSSSKKTNLQPFALTSSKKVQRASNSTSLGISGGCELDLLREANTVEVSRIR